MTAVSAAKTVRCNPSMPARAPARTRASESALANALTCAQSLWSQPAAHCSLSVASQVTITCPADVRVDTVEFADFGVVTESVMALTVTQYYSSAQVQKTLQNSFYGYERFGC